MSWDVSILKLSRHYEAASEIPSDERLLPLGSRQEVHDAVLAVFPGTDWSDPGWGQWASDFGSIEFNLGKDDPADGMMLHVRAGPQVVPGIVQLCLGKGWQGLDCSSGDFIERSADPAKSLVAWQAYRDQVVGKRG